MEVRIGDKLVPADIALDGFDPRGSLAVDLVGHHPLAPGQARCAATMGRSLAAREEAKVAKHGLVCQAAGWQFCPLGFHLWGGWGPMGSALLHRLVKQVVGDAQGWAQRHKATAVWQAISVAVMRFVAQQLLPMRAVATTSELPSTSDPWGGVASGMQVAAEDRGAEVGIRGAVATGSALPMGHRDRKSVV